MCVCKMCMCVFVGWGGVCVCKWCCMQLDGKWISCMWIFLVCVCVCFVNGKTNQFISSLSSQLHFQARFSYKNGCYCCCNTVIVCSCCICCCIRFIFYWFIISLLVYCVKCNLRFVCGKAQRKSYKIITKHSIYIIYIILQFDNR